ncbi:MAG: tetratricopeptide repeat protein [Myxococcales bacterium]|nr:tetratricopeptide repeat protein [Myxococcales bacterium]
MRSPLVVVALALSLNVIPTRVALAGPSDEAKAGQLFDKAEAEYQAGHFREAIDLLLEAQRLAPDAVLHYNLARAYEGLGELDPALASYRAYLEADPKTKDRGAVEARIKTLEQLKADRSAPKPAPPGPPADRPPPPPAEPDSASPVPWVIAGIGALGLGAAGVLGGLSLSKSNEAEEPATSGEDAARLTDEAQTFATGANVTFGVAGAILAAGLVWGIVDVATLGSDPDSPTASLRVELWGPGARITSRF